MKKLLRTEPEAGAVAVAEAPEEISQELSQSHIQNQSQLASQKSSQKIKVTFRFPASRVREVKKVTVVIRQALKQRFPRLRFNNEDFYDVAVKLLLDLPPEQRQQHAEEYLKHSLPGF